MSLDDHSSGRFLWDKFIDLLPLVRYIPAEAAVSEASVAGVDGWVKSDLKGVLLEDHNSRCYLCLDDFQQPRRRSSLKLELLDDGEPEPLKQCLCGHVFHRYCIDHWMHENDSCFLCRKILYPPEGYEEDGDWAILFNVVRDEAGTIKRAVNVDLLHIFQFKCSQMWCEQGIVFFACWQHGAVVIDTATGSQICVLGDRGLSSMCLNGDRLALITGDGRGRINIWNLADRRIMNTLLGHSDTLQGLEVSQDGNTLFSVADDESLRIWELPDGNMVKIRSAANQPHSLLCQTNTLSQYPLRQVGHVAFTPDGKGFLTGSDDHLLKLWDLATILDQQEPPVRSIDDAEWPVGAESVVDSTKTFTGHTDNISAVAVSYDGRWVLTGSTDHEVHLWDIETTAVQCLLVGEASVTSVSFCVKGDVFSTCCSDGSVQISRDPPSLARLNNCLMFSRLVPGGPTTSVDQSASHPSSRRFLFPGVPRDG
ncbi:hypothetical protein SCP_0605140 [Sparassis crispa]|uniref:RING-type domain-containing protein n=1 Tax=Sparassis crispa TaxID=139825 RepID=A0A401GQQ8_9APHY|nr:hypothetical protein SCP_0605140 [Sparassis crispa]GBE84535.1 hypothetical protein SCP_0605140 [Sparassis crispa]